MVELQDEQHLESVRNVDLYPNPTTSQTYQIPEVCVLTSLLRILMLTQAPKLLEQVYPAASFISGCWFRNSLVYSYLWKWWLVQSMHKMHCESLGGVRIVNIQHSPII